MNEEWFSPYLKEDKIKIYNVSLGSVIDTFPKITYEEFYNLLGEQSICQESSRKEIRDFIINKVHQK
jgi:hypothetical protein